MTPLCLATKTPTARHPRCAERPWRAFWRPRHLPVSARRRRPCSASGYAFPKARSTAPPPSEKRQVRSQAHRVNGSRQLRALTLCGVVCIPGILTSGSVMGIQPIQLSDPERLLCHCRLPTRHHPRLDRQGIKAEAGIVGVRVLNQGRYQKVGRRTFAFHGQSEQVSYGGAFTVLLEVESAYASPPTQSGVELV